MMTEAFALQEEIEELEAQIVRLKASMQKADNGVKLGRKSVSFGTVPTAAKLIAAHDSATLAVLRSMNKYSDNYIAESVSPSLQQASDKSG